MYIQMCICMNVKKKYLQKYFKDTRVQTLARQLYK